MGKAKKKTSVLLSSAAVPAAFPETALWEAERVAMVHATERKAVEAALAQLPPAERRKRRLDEAQARVRRERATPPSSSVADLLDALPAASPLVASDALGVQSRMDARARKLPQLPKNKAAVSQFVAVLSDSRFSRAPLASVRAAIGSLAAATTTAASATTTTGGATFAANTLATKGDFKKKR